MLDRWRLIDSGDRDCYYNMALDEAIAESVIKGLAPITLRFYGWQKQAVSIGAFQRIQDINTNYCVEQQIPIVRRPTGGRAILHGNELTYSLSATSDGIFSSNVKDSYILISRVFVSAFHNLDMGVEFSQKKASGRDLTRSPLCFNSVSIGEITYRGKKLVGSAQKRWRNGFLQQGSIPFEIDYDTIKTIFLGEDAYQFSDVKSIKTDITIEQLKDRIIDEFERYFQVCLYLAEPLEFEHQRALELVALKYQTHQWNFQKVRSCDGKRDET
ncbi:MAG: lipoate--protein ligase family protein [Thermodesulfovibrionales bacterium]|nr:lipoate--protein ligase family protein [Thermodesulfovibrionales bacterium]